MCFKGSQAKGTWGALLYIEPGATSGGFRLVSLRFLPIIELMVFTKFYSVLYFILYAPRLNVMSLNVPVIFTVKRLVV